MIFWRQRKSKLLTSHNIVNRLVNIQGYQLHVDFILNTVQWTELDNAMGPNKPDSRIAW